MQDLIISGVFGGGSRKQGHCPKSEQHHKTVLLRCSTANVGKRSSIDSRKTVPHLVYYCPDNRTRRFNATNTKLPLKTILNKFQPISILITCLPETRPNLLSPVTQLLIRSSVDHFLILHPPILQVY